MNPTQLGWVAGILEGEGCFSPAHSKAASGVIYNYARIQLSMTDEDVMQRFNDTVGVGKLSGPHYYKNKTWKPRWTWTVRSADAKELMSAILPLMGARRSEAIKSSLDL